MEHLVVGVIPERAARAFESSIFAFPGVEVWTPLTLAASGGWEDDPFVVARFAPGVTVEAAQAELIGIQGQLVADGLIEEGWSPLVLRTVELLDRDLRLGLWAAFGAVALVLVIACVNIASLISVRDAARGHEFAIRSALGAGRLRIARQRLVESLALCTVAGTAGLLLAHWTLGILGRVGGDDTWDLRATQLGPADVAFAVLVAVVIGTFFGLWPSRHLRQVSAGELVRGGRSATAGRRTSRGRRLLVAGEVALAVMLMLGSGLLLRTFLQLQQVDPGFEPARLVAVEMSLPEARYPGAEVQRAFFEEAVNSIERLPQVESASWALGVPPRLPAVFGTVEIQGREAADLEHSPVHTGNWVSDGYFASVGSTLRSGRTFEPADFAEGERVTLVNRAFARALWPDGDALGHRFRVLSPFSQESEPPDWWTIVGVVDDVKAFWLGDDPDRFQFYFPITDRVRNQARVIVRAVGDPLEVIPLIKERIWSVDAALPVDGIEQVGRLLDGTISRQRFNAALVGSFAGLGVFLAIVGVYGVLSLSVRQRAREIGVRVALGAAPGDVVSLVVRDGLIAIAAGLVLGVTASAVVGRYLESLLFGVGYTDPATYVAVLVLVGGVGLIACYVPSRRATSVDPVAALRQE